MVFNPCMCITLRTGSYIAGAVLIITSSCNVVLALLAILAHFNRALLINLAFHSLFLLTALPLFAGLISKTRELLFPFIIAAAYAGILSIVMLGITMSDARTMNQTQFLILWGAGSVLSLYSSVVVAFYWWELSQKFVTKRDDTWKLYVEYPYRRFGKSF